MPLDGYPAPPGNKLESIIDVNGPASYTPIAPGTPPTGGQVIAASQFGLQFLEFVEAVGSNDGQYDFVLTLLPSNQNKPGTSVVLAWYTAAGRGQVTTGTNLSTKFVRLMAVGY